MSDALARLARSEDEAERMQAAQLLAWGDVADKEAIVMRLLRDPGSIAVSKAMVASLLEARGEGAIRLILRSLGARRGDEASATAECLLESLLDSELDGLDVRGTIVSVLLETETRQEVLGALSAINWLAPSGGFSAPPRARERVSELTAATDAAVRAAAQRALAAFDSPWEQPDVG